MERDRKSEAIKNLRLAFNHVENKKSLSAVLRKEEELALEEYRVAMGLLEQLSPLVFPWPPEALPFAKPSEIETIARFRSTLEESDILASSEDRYYCSDLRLYQYLKARDFDVKHAMKMLAASLEWRRKALPAETESIESRTNHRVSDARIIGFDKTLRVVVYSSFSNTDKRDPKDVEVCIKAVLEKAAKISPFSSSGSVVWVNNFGCRHKNGFGWRDCNPKFLFSGISLFTDNYPESLATMVITDPPGIFFPLWNTIYPFLPEKTQKKAAFLNSRKGEAKAKEILRQTFEDEMVDWLWTQIIKDS